MVAIETVGLTRRFGDVVAVDGLDLQVGEGEVFGFLGPNGAGKTTTINMLLDFVRPTSGTATVLGYDSQTETMDVHRRVGILPQGFSLYDRLSGRKHVKFAIESKGSDETPDVLLERVGLDPTDANRPTGDYSRGMLQRLAMAMALSGDPDLLILDEPSSGLDPNGIRQMRDLVREEAESGTTIFFSSHILSQVESVCDRVGIMHDGSLVAVDSIEDLRESAGVGSRLVVAVDRQPDVDLAAIDGIGSVTTENGRVEVTCTDSRSKAIVIDRLIDDGVTVLDFETEEASLEDLFSTVTEREGQA